MSAQQLYDKLIASNIVGATGQIYFEMNDIKTMVQDSSVVGNIIQEWLKSFMNRYGIYCSMPTNTQEFPDYFLNADSNQLGLLEVKCFKNSPNFDIANFIAYCRSLATSPYRLDADYLIFKYENTAQGIVIKDIWLKKVWQIASASERSAVKIQWKQNVAVNIRPATWYSSAIDYPTFATRTEFVQALKKVLDTNAAGGDWRKNWIKTVADTYKIQTGNNL
jgi:NgoBV restriction endonuclease